MKNKICLDALPKSDARGDGKQEILLCGLIITPKLPTQGGIPTPTPLPYWLEPSAIGDGEYLFLYNLAVPSYVPKLFAKQ